MTEKKSIALPTIHLNGSSAQILWDLNFEALQTIGDTLEKLRNAQPHGRDYYVQTPDGYKQAHEEHLERLRKLESVREELKEICRSIKRQGGDKVIV